MDERSWQLTRTRTQISAFSPFEDVVWLYDDAGNRDLETTSVATDYVANALACGAGAERLLV